MRKYLLLTILVLFTVCLFAQPANAIVEKDPMELLNHLYAPKGELPLRDLIADADLYAYVKEHPYSPDSMLTNIYKFRIFYTAPNKLRIDQVNTNKTVPSVVLGAFEVVIRDGKTVFIYVPYGDMPVKMDLDKPSPSIYLPFYIQKYPTYNNFKYVYLGQEKEGDKIIDVVGIINPKEDYAVNMTKLWIDSEKWVPAKLEYTKYVDPKKKGDTYTKRVTYTDVRQIRDGRYWPFKIKIEELNKDTKDKFEFESTLIYKDVIINTDLDPDLFAPMKKYLK
ncbi:MAG: outer membrane lipoprotein-sorting protein [Armatimonadota bacterium]